MSQQPYTAPFPPNYGYGQPPLSNKSFLTAWLLSLLLGVFGVDRFYLGKVGQASLSWSRSAASVSGRSLTSS